jgi:hypothetical protein
MPIPIPISYLPYVGPTGYTIQDLLVIVNHNDSPFTGVTKNTYLTDLKNYFAFTGGTVPGPTNFTGGLSANTISATTYYNLPGSSSGNCFLDFYVTNVHGCSPITIWDEVQSNGSTASGTLSFAFGYGVTASGDYSHAEGYQTESLGESSHAEGYQTIAGLRSFGYVSANTIENGVIILTGGTNYSTEFTGSYVYIIDSLGSIVAIEQYTSTSFTTPNFQIDLLDNTLYLEGVFSVVDTNNLFSLSANTYTNNYSHSEGGYNKALGNYSHSEGGGVFGKPPFVSAVGNNSFGTGSHSEGASTISYGIFSHSEGFLTTSVGVGSHSEGSNTTASGESSHSEGYQTKALQEYSHAEGNNTTASGASSHSEGFYTTSIGSSSHAEGVDTISYGKYSHSEGNSTYSGYIGISCRFNECTSVATIDGDYTSILTQPQVLLEGKLCSILSITYDSGTDKTTINLDLPEELPPFCQSNKLTSITKLTDLYNPNNTFYESSYSHSEGSNTYSVGYYSHSEGSGTTSTGYGSHAEGDNTTSLGFFSHSEGYDTLTGLRNAYLVTGITAGLASLSSSYGNATADFQPSQYLYMYNIDFNNTYSEQISAVTYNGTFTQIQLYNTSLNSTNTWYVGDPSIDIKDWNGDLFIPGDYSHAEGDQTKSSGKYSHAEGSGTYSLGNVSHAEGEGSVSLGYGSHAEGSSTKSIGEFSHTEGRGTIAYGNYQHVSGLYNLTGDTTDGAFIIGNGTSDVNRSNLLFAASSAVTITGQLGVGTTGIVSSAAIQIDSTTQGFLPPRMSATDAESISAVEGLIVYITGGTGAYITSKGWWGYTGNTSTDWAKIGP